MVSDHDIAKKIRIKFTLGTSDSVPVRISFELLLAFDKEKERLTLPMVAIEHLDRGLGISITNDKTVLYNEKGSILEYENATPFALSMVRELFSSMMLKTFATMLDDVKEDLRAIRKNEPKTIIESGKTAKEIEVQSLMGLTDLIGWINQTMESLTYIGPMREYPKRYYQTSGERFLHVGKRGEHAIEIVCNEDILGRQDIQCKLAYWLKQPNVADTIRLKPLGTSLYALRLRTPVRETEVNIADTGFGVSQIVPIIVEICVLKRNDTLILEQPEIHLHPVGQMMMADLLLEAAAQGRRFIIETHSEHLLLRIQRRIAERKISADLVVVHYFEPTKDGIKIHELKILENGQFENLPSGFMDERLEEAYKIALGGEE